VWLNNNQLTGLRGLERNFRIKHLFLQNNKIKAIDGIFDVLKHIETLVLYDNELRDLDGIIKNLKVLTSLNRLDLFENPAAHEPNYKMRVLADIFHLQVLDRHKVPLI
jgi:Leucine-rich repeat (LRR) protein